jgi:hypothetical protein
MEQINNMTLENFKQFNKLYNESVFELAMKYCEGNAKQGDEYLLELFKLIKNKANGTVG